MRHRIPHTLELYRRTALNLAAGKRTFRKRFVRRQKQQTIVLSFDPDDRSDLKAMPALLDLLKRRKMTGSFAAVGTWVERYPALWRRVAAEGHEIINHTQTHPDNAELNPRHYHELTFAQRKDEIERCHKTVKRVLGVTMKGFRTPHFGYQHTRDTYAILKKLGYRFSSSTLAIDTPKNGFPYRIGGVTEFPLSPCPRHPWALFDSSHAFRGRVLKHSAKQFLADFETLLDSGAFLNIYLDPQDFSRYDFEALLDAIAKRKLRTVTYARLLQARGARR